MPRIGDIARRDKIELCGRGKMIWSACPDCGIERWVPLNDPQKICLSCNGKRAAKRGQLQSPHKTTCDCQKCRCTRGELVGENSPSWKGGRRTVAKGYIAVRIDSDDPFHDMAWKNESYVLEHRLVMARKLGRSLRKHEQVHHRNGIRSDNRPENLELWSTAHPIGVRVKELYDE